jgi:hypothetical protein
MDLTLMSLDASFADLEEAESTAFELDAMIGGLGPVPAPLPGIERPGEPIGTELDEDAFNTSILAALVSAR